jgi:hypothetical protein
MTARGRLDALVAWLKRPSASLTYGMLVRRARDGPEKPPARLVWPAFPASDPQCGATHRSAAILSRLAPRRNRGRP